MFTSAITPKENAPTFGIYLFGTDELGRDVFARMLEGTSVSLSLGKTFAEDLLDKIFGEFCIGKWEKAEIGRAHV